MHAKQSSTGLRFFAHDSKPANCSTVGETPEHRQLKRALADLVRSLGCTAEIEAAPATGDAGGWRADVLGTSPNGIRVAFEVQLASMTTMEGARRTSRYAADGIGCLWISTRQAPWMTEIPSCHIIQDESLGFIADRGLARFQQGRWTSAGAVPLRKAVLGMLTGRIVAVPGGYFLEDSGGRQYSAISSCLLVSVADAQRARQHDQDARRGRDAAERDEARHTANLQELVARQSRVLQHALQTLVATGIQTSEVRLGIPSRPWNGSIPADWRVAVGNEKTAQGAAIWIDRGGVVELWAVICPVAGQASERLGNSWRRRGVKVFVETQKEAARVDRALAWSMSTILQSSPAPSSSVG
jgi:competence protein CoiA